MALFIYILLLLLIAALIGVGIAYFVRHHPGLDRFRQGRGGDEGDFVTVVGGFYAILLAFMVLVVWTRFDQAENIVDQEANAVANLFRIAQSLPQPWQDEIEEYCREYVRLVTTDEWPAMAHDSSSPAVWALNEQMWERFARMEMQGIGDETLRQQALAQFVSATTYRRERLFMARSGLPSVLWVTILVTGMLVITCAVVFGTGSFALHAYKGAVLGAMIVLILFIIWALSHPFAGFVRVMTDPFTNTLTVFATADR